MTKSNTFQSNSILSGLLLILYLCIGFIPNLGAVDKIAPQWLALSVLNLTTFGYLYNQRRSFSHALTATITSWLSITYISFIIWAGLSYFYSINPTEVIVNIARQVNVMLMVLIMSVLIYQFPNKARFISWCITLILGFEIYAVIVEAQEMISKSGIISPGALKGVTANRNITAFSLAIKIPFVLFLLHLVTKRYMSIAYAYNSIESIMLNDDSVKGIFCCYWNNFNWVYNYVLTSLSKTSKKKFYL